MTNLKKLPQTSESNIQTYKKTEVIKLSMALAIERTNTPAFNVDNLVGDVLDEFKGVSVNIITEAIKKGSLGSYGKTYKLSTQEVCIWVREHIKIHGKVSKEDFISNDFGTFEEIQNQ